MARAEPDWLRLQKKIFGRYTTQKLRQAGIKREVQDIIGELKDGVLLIDLMEALSGKKFAGKKVAAKARIQQIDVLGKALDFVKECGVPQKTPISAEDIVDGNEKVVLGFLFQIILAFMKFDDDPEAEAAQQSGGVKEALLLWFQNKTAGYSGVSVTGFQGAKAKGFHDGLVFCALIHKLRPNLIDYASLDQANKEANLELALSTAAKYCNVERYLEASDIPKLDELSLIVYLSDWFYGIALLQKQDIAARRIGKLAVMTDLHDKMRAQFTENATELRSWVDSKVSDLSDRTFDDTMSGIRQLLDEFYHYKGQEKSERIAKHMDLQGLFNNLALRLHNAKRPPFVPAPALTLDALDAKFSELDVAEAARSVALHEELARQIKLDRMATRLRTDAGTLSSAAGNWKSSILACGQSVDSVESAEHAIEELGRLKVDVEHAASSRLAQIKGTAAELYSERYEFAADIQSVEGALDSAFSTLTGTDLPSKKAQLDAALAEQLQINDTLCREFADAAHAFTGWLDGKKQVLKSNVGTSDDLEQQLEALEASTSDHGDVDGMLAAIDASSEKVAARGIVANPHTTFTSGDARALWQQFGILLSKKRQLLQEAIADKAKAGMSDEQMQEIKDNFKYFDKNGSGALDRRELRICMQSLGEEASPQRVSEIMDEYDTDKNGNLTEAEFTAFMTKVLGDSDDKEEIIQAFKYLTFDENTISVEQLQAVVNEISFRTWHVEYLAREIKQGNWQTWVEEVFAR